MTERGKPSTTSTHTSNRRIALDKPSVGKNSNMWACSSCYCKTDFTTEQAAISPPNGWKAYYAATKAVIGVNEEWYRVCKLKSLRGMSRLWLNADYVKCILPGRAVFTGYEKVLQSWAITFQWDQHNDRQLRDVQARVFGDMAWVTFKEFFNAAIGPALATNIFEFHNGQWFMVHHHSSPMVEVGIGDPMVLV
ncbi:F-box protein SKIP8 isoform X2 [Cryptomeria japonica]|uniref:F-box protein SKIP8 isoform X2 n=1 Tax=Cryptomeria japonica TaxID=3369 RepID=UPI0027D9EB65|nr:F-box protein SKIP8 isoform X2 [Cryptomeria japonica]